MEGPLAEQGIRFSCSLADSRRGATRMTSWRELGVEVLFTFSMPLFYAFLTTMMYGESSPTLASALPACAAAYRSLLRCRLR